MNDDEFESVLSNLYAGSHQAACRLRDEGQLRVAAARPNSSQALCVSVFGSFAKDRWQKRGPVMRAILAEAGLATDERSAPRLGLEVTDPALLNEHGGTPSTIDVLAKWDTLTIAIESKFTEELGPCGQRGANAQAPCTGELAPGSDRATGTSAPCRLTVWDGNRSPRLYWDIAAAVFRPEVTSTPQVRCPFEGSQFQLMRNLCFAAAHAQRARRHAPASFGLLVAYVASADSAPATMAEVARLRARVLPEVRPRVGLISYETIAAILRGQREPDLAGWIETRIAAVCQ